MQLNTARLPYEDEEMDELIARCAAHHEDFCKVILSERFPTVFSQLHQEIFKILDDPTIQRAVIAAPRGFGKTSIVNIGYTIKNIVFRDKKFIVPISNTASQAVLQSENIKRELLMNSEVRRLFGPMKSDNFSKEVWETASGTMVMPRGGGQQVRGILFDRYRPDLIILDDVENKDDVKNPELRKAIKEWFFADVCNSVDRSSKDWRIILIGTILHEDSLLANLLEDPNWHSVRLELCDDNYKSHWREFISDEEIKKLANSFRMLGLLDVFFREYRNLPIATEDATFQQSYFKYHDESDTTLFANVENVILVDPAKTVKLHSDYSAIVGVGIDRILGKIYQRDLVSERFYPDELYDAIFAMAQRLNARVIGLEVTSLHEFITFPFRNEMMQRGQFYEIIELKARGSKEERIASLVPLYRKGMISHNIHTCTRLESQLLSFPRAQYDDCSDAFAYIVEMMELGQRFFAPTVKDQQDEFAGLVDDPPLNINWKAI